MKNDTLKSLFLLALVAVGGFLLRSGCSDEAKKVIETIYVPRNDTITRWSLPETPAQLQDLLLADPALRSWMQSAFEKVVYRRDTIVIHDQAIDLAPTPVDTPVWIVFTDPEWTENMRLFEGEVQGDSGRCVFRYLAGLQFDSLQFMAIEGNCTQKTETLNLSPDFLVGAKIGWSPQTRSLRYGVQSSWKNLYGAANYAPGDKSWLFEAGVLLPIGRKKQKTSPILRN